MEETNRQTDRQKEGCEREVGKGRHKVKEKREWKKVTKGKRGLAGRLKRERKVEERERVVVTKGERERE